jgi:hypothetical protein
MHETLSKHWDGEELAWEVGSQLCGLIAEHEKTHLTSLATSRFRQEYFRGRK